MISEIELFERKLKMKGRRFAVCMLAMVAAVILFALPAEAGEKVQYRLRLEEGKKYCQKTITEQKISQTIMGQQQDIEQTIGVGMDFDVNDVDDSGNTEILCVYRWSKFRQKTPMEEILYDSSKKGASVPPAAQGFAALVGESYLLKVTPEGLVQTVSGTAKMRSNVRKKLPSGLMGDLLLQSIEPYVGEKTIRELTEARMAMYPNKAVGTGDSWAAKYVLSEGFAMIVENKWRLKERKNNVATIEVSSTIEPNPKAAPMDMGMMKMSYQFSGKQHGLMYMDETTGLIMGSKLNQQMSGEVKMSGAQTMTTPMKVDGVITMEMTERKK